jgi:hypothetical protein
MGPGEPSRRAEVGASAVSLVAGGSGPASAKTERKRELRFWSIDARAMPRKRLH